MDTPALPGGVPAAAEDVESGGAPAAPTLTKTHSAAWAALDEALRSVRHPLGCVHKARKKKYFFLTFRFFGRNSAYRRPIWTIVTPIETPRCRASFWAVPGPGRPTSGPETAILGRGGAGPKKKKVRDDHG